jgi:hypothetical protein
VTDDAEHARKFAQVSRNLAKLAETLSAQHPDFPRGDFGRAFLTTAIALLLDAAGGEETARYLRELAAGIEAGRHALPPLN